MQDEAQEVGIGGRQRVGEEVGAHKRGAAQQLGALPPPALLCGKGGSAVQSKGGTASG